MSRMSTLHLTFMNINKKLEEKKEINFFKEKSTNKTSIKEILNGEEYEYNYVKAADRIPTNYISNLFYALEEHRETNNVTKNMVYLIDNSGNHNLGRFLRTSHFIVNFKETKKNINFSIVPYTPDIKEFDLLITTEQL